MGVRAGKPSRRAVIASFVEVNARKWLLKSTSDYNEYLLLVACLLWYKNLATVPTMAPTIVTYVAASSTSDQDSFTSIRLQREPPTVPSAFEAGAWLLRAFFSKLAQ